ncbi:phytosulfokines 5 [Beta vulgaris subsp. vulgaris]|uniref:phytosulfokines 5 n=1 Tax=Beta vulgaris subsp. vulgaris TaxID=3555 RepID=UPI002036BC6D|nr:phytosulfokines 5 [Beta vulgaris subsp. vulgaris]
MKKISVSLFVVLLFTFLVLSHIASARVLQPKVEQGNRDLKIKDAANHEDISNLMGLDEIEVCGTKEGEDCTNERKLLAEAHLDYIYTQKLNKP